MCDPDPYEFLEKARREGWVPVVVVLAELREMEGEPIVDIGKLKYHWGVPEEAAVAVALRFIAEMKATMVEEEIRRVREN